MIVIPLHHMKHITYKLTFLVFSLILLSSFSNFNSNPKVGDVIDSLNGIAVYYNGDLLHVSGRNVTADGYNLGLKWQCVEFTKRYYYERFGHKMPNSYGHAKEFFDKSLGDVAYNPARGLHQFKNVRNEKPRADDIIVYDAYDGNPYGHIGIIAEVGPDYIIMVQQNVGKKSRQKLNLVEYNGIYTVADFDVLGWLRI